MVALALEHRHHTMVGLKVHLLSGRHCLLVAHIFDTLLSLEEGASGACETMVALALEHGDHTMVGLKVHLLEWPALSAFGPHLRHSRLSGGIDGGERS